MTVNRGHPTETAGLGLDRATAAREAAQSAAAESKPVQPASTPVSDHIALSLATNLVQQASSAGDKARIERILELKHAIEARQYRIDPLAVGHALIKAGLLGD